MERGAGRAGAISVRGDVALIIEELAPRLRGRSRADWDVAELDRLKRAHRVTTASGELSLPRAVEIVRALTPPGTIAAVDEGASAAVVAPRWQAVGPNQFLVGAGDVGQPFAPAAAVAASLARPGGYTVAFTDAAGLAAAADAIATARRLEAPVLLIDLGIAGAETRPLQVDVPEVVVFDEEQLTRALPRAPVGRGPSVIRVRVRPPRG
jgi:thiamine pyrophosphate-dependent acetolactate synthase large subunit-like protein